MHTGHSCGWWPSGQHMGKVKQGLGPAHQAASQVGAIAPRWGHYWRLTEHRYSAGACWEGGVPQHRVLCQDCCTETCHWAHLSSGRPGSLKAWTPHAQTRCHAPGTRTSIRNPPAPVITASRRHLGVKAARSPDPWTKGQCWRGGLLGHHRDSLSLGLLCFCSLSPKALTTTGHSRLPTPRVALSISRVGSQGHP